jgi:hypothetical protein
MPRDTGRNDRRSRIAYLAARLMAEDGIEDYALAKRKAARQAGVPDTRELPANEEIAEALRTYQQIYHPEEHRDRLRGCGDCSPGYAGTLLLQPLSDGVRPGWQRGKYADINLQPSLTTRRQSSIT